MGRWHRGILRSGKRRRLWSMTSFSKRERRPLTQEERTLLEWLIANGSEDDKTYSPQLADLGVVGTCTCGCPTIDLALRGRDQRKTAPSKILADFVGTTPEGIEVGVILHVREGEISELEVYPIANATGPFRLPTIESLKQF
jgi:hypothetical protein